MHLVLTLPARWRVTAAEGGRQTIDAGDVTLEVEPLVPVPDDARGWIHACMRRGAPAFTRLGELLPVVAKNDLGWPMEIYATNLLDAAGNPVEARAAAFYKFQEYAGHVLALAPDAATLDELRGLLLTAFQSGRPDWTGPGYVASISELWS